MASTVQHDHEPRVLDRARLSRYLDGLEESKRPISLKMVTPVGDTDGWEWLPRPARKSPAGLALIECEEGPQLLAAVAPPFPISASSEHDDLSALRAHIAKPVTVGVILLRLGYYAIGVASDETLVVTKTGSRYVRGGHRAGGQSANRFKRNREKWIREFFDEACEVARTRFAQSPGPIDWFALGGDRQVLARFLKRCPHLYEPRETNQHPGKSPSTAPAEQPWTARSAMSGPRECMSGPQPTRSPMPQRRRAGQNRN